MTRSPGISYAGAQGGPPAIGTIKVTYASGIWVGSTGPIA